eukprot:scaffold485835_cov31-Prasinocladus_malaysianus.AAC.1
MPRKYLEWVNSEHVLLSAALPYPALPYATLHPPADRVYLTSSAQRYEFVRVRLVATTSVRLPAQSSSRSSTYRIQNSNGSDWSDYEYPNNPAVSCQPNAQRTLLSIYSSFIAHVVSLPGISSTLEVG